MVIQEPEIEDEDFSALLDESFHEGGGREGQVVRGTVIQREGDEFVIDVGLKSEGRLPVREFTNGAGELTINIGDHIDVYVERGEDQNGQVMLSREKAKREEAWMILEKAFTEQTVVNGRIVGKVKGGYTVDINSLAAFLPGSQVDVRPMHDVVRLQDEEQEFDILKMDRRRGNIVVSRRTVIERQREDARQALLETLHEGMILDGVVKNITDYGAFVDLGGLDGLLHITDMSWKRVKHPSGVVAVGDTVAVQVIKFNPETQRISLGMKQLMIDPWADISIKYPSGGRFSGVVTNLTDYGAFVELEAGVEGLAHVSELSWTKKNLHPSKVLEVGQPVDVMILDVDSDRRRISLGIKQCMENPWENFAARHPVGGMVTGEIKNITEFGLFVGLEGEIDGLVHLSDISWDASSGEEILKSFQKGQQVSAVVLVLDPDKERISLGIKQIQPDDWSLWADANPKGATVRGVIKEVMNTGIVVTLADGIEGVIRRSDLSLDNKETAVPLPVVGNEIDAKIVQVDRQRRKVSLSVRALEMDQDRQAMKEYTTQKGVATNSLGDALSEALERAQTAQSES
ncbi:MAG: 30S ribosomal protein S1 [Magnetococcales bacterium]|nr:30S ribosomal protein S1 [Magnetococcales bacterium]